jgi:outer membrane protein assembly factor BamB
MITTSQASDHSRLTRKNLGSAGCRWVTLASASCWVAVVCFLCISKAKAANWPQFRGPAAAGVDGSKPLPTTWDLEKGENVRWQTPVPGMSHASPIVWGDAVYVATVSKAGDSELKTGLYGDIEPLNEKENHQWRLIAIEKATGKVSWNTLGCEGVPKVKRHPKASHSNSTPATDGKRIVAIFGSEGLFCFDTKGKLIWKKDLGPMDAGFFAVPSAQWGFASSPVIHEGKVIVLCDVQTNSFLGCFDLADGREIWRTPRKDVPTWGTPAVVEAMGTKQIAVNGWHETGGYDFASGRNLWRLNGGGDIPVPTPLFAHGLIYLTSAHGSYRPLRAVRPDATGDITPPDPGKTNQAIVWAHARQGNYMQTPIVVGDLLFACVDNGLLSCVEAKTGRIHYSKKLSSENEGFTSSPVSDGKQLFFASEQGHVFVVPVSDKFSVVATNDLQEQCMATPAISDGTLYYRTKTKLVAIGSSRIASR